jgi:hypothetical protein
MGQCGNRPRWPAGASRRVRMWLCGVPRVTGMEVAAGGQVLPLPRMPAACDSASGREAPSAWANMQLAL